MIQRAVVTPTVMGLSLALWPLWVMAAVTEPANPAEISLVGASLRIELNRQGQIVACRALRSGDWQSIAFRQDPWGGPTWVVERPPQVERLTLEPAGGAVFETCRDGVRFRLAYAVEEDRLRIVATIENDSDRPFAPQRAGLCLGLDCAQVKYPEWKQIYFPTLLRCEATHFWGYFMNPDGNLLGIASPDPVASWHHEYKPLGHLLFTSTVDLLNQPPLPPRHPQDSSTVAPGQRRSWTFWLQDLPSLDAVPQTLGRLTAAPMVTADRYTLAAGEHAEVTLYSELPCQAEVTSPAGQTRPLELSLTDRRGVFRSRFTPGETPGPYTICVRSENGHRTEATVCLRRPWSWYLQQARREAIAKPQKASSNCESWLGLYSGFLAMRHFPTPAEDVPIGAKFDELFPLLYDPASAQPRAAGAVGEHASRLQNHSMMAGLLAAKFQATGEIRDLERAAALVDVVLGYQASDGALRRGQTHYTSVTYCAKSLLEVVAQEEKRTLNDPVWRERAQRHRQGVQAALDELARSRDNIETEGELTYEDGMIACSYTQLALGALRASDPARRQRYQEASLALKDGHRCLAQIVVPDGRMNGGSLRYWESQYDVLMTPNLMSSPHGWSAWRIYGLWYLYLLTGEEELLRQTQNALGSCVQLLEPQTGELRWGFMSDPYVAATVLEPDPERPGRGRLVSRTLGECYVPMISGWYQAPPSTWVTGYWGADGGSCDNDVHEIFKCLEEVALTSAYLVERADGELMTWNCTVERRPEGLVVVPAERVVNRIHLNLRRPQRIVARFADGPVEIASAGGLHWIGPGGTPELLRPER